MLLVAISCQVVVEHSIHWIFRIQKGISTTFLEAMYFYVRNDLHCTKNTLICAENIQIKL